MTSKLSGANPLSVVRIPRTRPTLGLRDGWFAGIFRMLINTPGVAQTDGYALLDHCYESEIVRYDNTSASYTDISVSYVKQTAFIADTFVTIPGSHICIAGSCVLIEGRHISIASRGVGIVALKYISKNKI